MKRSRWGRALRNFERRLDNISYCIMVMKNFEKRERAIEQHTHEKHKFCIDKYIETPIEI